mgnify:CR=1 FL=1
MTSTEQASGMLTANIIGFDGMYAVLNIPEAPDMRWPIRHLPEGVDVGSPVQIKMITAKTENEEKFERMRKVLEELIN